MGIRGLAARSVIEVYHTNPTLNIMPELVGLLQHKERNVHDLAVTILEGMESNEYPSLLADRELPSYEVKQYMIEVLRDSKTKTVPALVNSLRSFKRPTDLWYILDLLGKLGDSSIEPLLLTLLSDPEPMLRWGAAHALRKIATLEAEPALTAALQDVDPRVQSAAYDALMVLQERQRKATFWTRST